MLSHISLLQKGREEERKAGREGRGGRKERGRQAGQLCLETTLWNPNTGEPVEDFKSDSPAFSNHGRSEGNIIILNRSHLHFEVALNLKLLGDLIKFHEDHSCSTKMYWSTHLVIPEEIKQQHEDRPQLSHCNLSIVTSLSL